MNAASPVETLVTDHLDLWTTALKRKSTAGRGSSSKVELYGIRKLRELILELAVRGLLVPQDPNDEPASELLKKIATEKARLVKEGKIKQGKLLPPITDEQVPFQLPTGWSVARLGTVSTVITKGTTPTSVGLPFESFGVNFLKIENIENGRVDRESITQFISEETNRLLARSQLEVGDLLFSIAGTIGKTAVIFDEDLPANTNQALAIVRGTETVFLPQYLRVQLDSFVAETTRQKARGGAMPNVSLGDLNVLVSPIPPLAEQHRIVAKVNELMALCDQLEQQTDASLSAHQTLVETLLSALTSAADHAQFVSAWQRIAGQFDTLFTTEESIALLKQTILQLAVMGKLVPQDLNEEPAGALLERMEKERRRLLKEGSLKKLPQLPELDPRKRSVALPIGWSWGFIPQVIANDKYAIKRGPFGSAIRKDFFVPTGYKVYEQQHAIRDDFSLGNYYLSEDKFHELKAFEVKPNDIVISCSGTVGRVAVAPPWMEPGVINQALLKLTLNQSALTNDYFKILFPAYYMKTETLSELQGTAQKNMVSVETLKEEAFPLPPLSEQHRIVAKVDELMALCEQLKSRLSDAQTTQLHLADAIVEQAIG